MNELGRSSCWGDHQPGVDEPKGGGKDATGDVHRSGAAANGALPTGQRRRGVPARLPPVGRRGTARHQRHPQRRPALHVQAQQMSGSFVFLHRRRHARHQLVRRSRQQVRSAACRAPIDAADRRRQRLVNNGNNWRPASNTRTHTHTRTPSSDLRLAALTSSSSWIANRSGF